MLAALLVTALSADPVPIPVDVTVRPYTFRDTSEHYKVVAGDKGMQFDVKVTIAADYPTKYVPSLILESDDWKGLRPVSAFCVPNADAFPIEYPAKTWQIHTLNVERGKTYWIAVLVHGGTEAPKFTAKFWGAK